MSDDKAKIHLWSLILGVGFFFFSTPSFSQEILENTYVIQADFRDIQKRTFAIEMDAMITNRTSEPLQHLMWMIYPNRFLKELPNLNDLNYRRIYPDGFSSGSIDIQSLTLDGKELLQTLDPVSNSPIPEKSLHKLPLLQPMKPGETKIFHFKMTLHVPEKFGSFGYYDGRLTLSGGWTPYVVAYRNGEFQPMDQSPQANWKVTLTTDSPMVIGSEVFKEGVSSQTFERSNSGQFPLQISKHIKVNETEQKGYKLKTIVDERKPEKILLSLESIFEPWVNYAEELKVDTASSSKNLSFVQAPLREMLAVDANDMSFFSDRAYKVIQGLKQFHNVPLIRMMFSQMMYPQILKKENSRDYHWVNEVVATQLAENFLQTQHYKTRDARKLGVIRLFSIFPLIDQLIHTPQFAFFDVFYNFSYPYDPVRDEFMRFQHRRQYGKSIIAHMEDELGGQAVKDIVMEYVRSPDQSFLQVSEKYSGKKLDERFSH